MSSGRKPSRVHDVQDAALERVDKNDADADATIEECLQAARQGQRVVSLDGGNLCRLAWVWRRVEVGGR